MKPGVRYADVRPYTVPESLADLEGPVEGVIELPITLDWSQQRRYDLSVDKDRRRLYETVIREAMDPAELTRLLHGSLLVTMWPSLWLPVQVKSLWEQRFSQLRHIAAA